MITKNCALCGVIIDPNFDNCETCFAMLDGGRPQEVAKTVYNIQAESPYQTTIDKVPAELLENNSFAHNPAVSQDYQQNVQTPNQTPEVEIEFERFPTPPLAMTTAGNDTRPNFSADHNAEMQAAVQSFVPPAFATLDTMNRPLEQSAVPRIPRYAPPRSSASVVKSEYKPTLWAWIKDLPGLVKAAAVVVVFSICFAVVLKGFMTLDVSIQPGLGATEPQTPWFSSYFRSTPTPEEIFKKYEAETQATENAAIVQSYLISGNAQFLFTPPDGTLDIIGIRKKMLGIQDASTAKATPAPAASPMAANNLPQQWDFDITFEMAMKTPNKMLIKMLMKPKAGFTQAFSSVKTVGFDGDRGWIVTKSQAGGNQTTDEGKFEPKAFLFHQHKNGISLAFLEKSFKQAELIGFDVTYNRLAYNVKLTDDNGNANALFDIETGMLSRISRDGDDVFILAHENFDGVKLPSKLIYRIGRAWVYMDVQKVQNNVAFDDTIFLRATN